MNEQKKPVSLDGLVEAATDSVRQQQERAAAVRPPRARGQQVVLLVLLATFAGVAIYQYPRINAPYALPDASSDPAVVEAELQSIADLIERYRLVQGKYPDSLDDLQLPAGLTAVFSLARPEYRLEGDAYAIDWKLPEWHAIFDGEDGTVVVTSRDTTGPKP